MTNEDRIARARGGDLAALGELLESYRGYLRTLARIEIGRRLQGKVDASDVVQEAFLDAHRQFPAFRGTAEGELAGWLRQILAGTLSNALRRFLGTQARDLRLEQSLRAGLDHSSASLGQVFADARGTPSQEAIRGEQSLRVASALAQLPPDYQAVILHRQIERLSFREVAERMQRSVDSVEKLWIRAVSQLRRHFKEAP